MDSITREMLARQIAAMKLCEIAAKCDGALPYELHFNGIMVGMAMAIGIIYDKETAERIVDEAAMLVMAMRS